MPVTKTTDDLRIANLRQLIAPQVLMEMLPITDRVIDTVAASRAAATAIIHGSDDRLLVVAGPCSIHDPAAALEYAGRLAGVRERLRGELEIVMRVYFEKPRTTVGWKGLINDPGLDGSFNINLGLKMARELLLELGEMGMPSGSELLDTITPQYIGDLISWGAIGARTTESQVHRELASGMSVPIGFKNGTDGNIQIAIDAIHAAERPHHFLSVTKGGDCAIVETTGNDACHVILRGSNRGPNFDAAAVADVTAALEGAGDRGSVMVDCSHGNSRKDHERQAAVASDLASQIAAGSSAVFGLMLESHLLDGRQDLGDDPASLVYGRSVTDACMSWEATVPVLDELAEAVRTRRAAA